MHRRRSLLHLYINTSYHCIHSILCHAQLYLQVGAPLSSQALHVSYHLTLGTHVHCPGKQSTSGTAVCADESWLLSSTLVMLQGSMPAGDAALQQLMYLPCERGAGLI